MSEKKKKKKTKLKIFFFNLKLTTHLGTQCTQLSFDWTAHGLGRPPGLLSPPGVFVNIGRKISEINRWGELMCDEILLINNGHFRMFEGIREQNIL